MEFILTPSNDALITRLELRIPIQATFKPIKSSSAVIGYVRNACPVSNERAAATPRRGVATDVGSQFNCTSLSNRLHTRAAQEHDIPIYVAISDYGYVTINLEI